MKMMGRPLKSSGDLTAIRKPAPWLGQHSAEVLRGLGYSQDEIDRLFAERVVYDRYRT
jgi:crotonobetainyl-CoA:carnitine CoA-transferase CaiB-like acyl-CoA transferase